MIADDLLLELERLNSPRLDSCTVPAHWLLLEFPLLTSEGFLAGISHLLSTEEPAPGLEEEFYQLCLSKLKEFAEEQVELLIEMGNDSSAAKNEYARKTIGAMLISACADQPKEIKHYCLRRVSDAVRYFSELGLPGYLIDSLDICLCSNLQLSEKIRLNLLHALIQCADAGVDEPDSAITFFRTARILHDALLLEIQRALYAQSSRYYQLLMDSMASYPYHLAPATLKALSLTSCEKSLREMADAAFHAVTESLEIRWVRTISDKLASLESRKERLAALCHGETDQTKVVQVIFSNLKGLPIDQLDDPRLATIKTLMTYADSIKMAGCWSVFAQGEYSEEIDKFLQGIAELSELAINSGSAGLSHDAVKLLRQLQKQHPDLSSTITEQTEKASMRFVNAILENGIAPALVTPSIPLIDERD